MYIKKILPVAVITLLALIPFVGQAAEIQRGGWGLQDIVGFMDTVANWLYVISFAVALIIIIVGGLRYMTSGGNEDNQKKAKQMIITGLIGVAIILLAGIVLDTLVKFLGVSAPN